MIYNYSLMLIINKRLKDRDLRIQVQLICDIRLGVPVTGPTVRFNTVHGSRGHGTATGVVDTSLKCIQCIR